MTKFRVLLPLLLLAGCLPAFQEGAPVLHDVALYTGGGGRLYGYLYGEPATLSVGGRELELTQGASDDPLSVPGALLVEGEPYLQQDVAPLTNAPVAIQTVPYSTDLTVSANEAVLGVRYYDGERWFTLLGEAVAGFSGRVVPRAEADGLYGLGALTRAEAEVFGRRVQAQGPVVVTALAEVRERTRQANGLGDYRHTALAVQRGLETVDEPVGVTPTPLAAPWRELGRGTQATGGDAPSFELATSEAQLENLWRRAYGAMLTPPPTPEVDFGRESVAAVFLGTRTSGGYGVEVHNVTLEGADAYLDVAVTEPAPGTLTTQALTNPWVMVALGVPDLSKVNFRGTDDGELLGVAQNGQ